MQTTDPVIVQALCDFKVVHHLSPFLAKEATLSEASTLLGITSQRMSYWIGKLIKLGLIKFVRFEKQSRHQVAVYRSMEDEYVVPFSLLGDGALLDFVRSTHATRFEQLERSMARNLSRRSASLQLRMWRDERGPFYAIENPRDATDTFGVADEIYPLWLDRDEIDALHREIRAMLAKYYALSDRKKSSTALLYIGLAENPLWSTEL
jgi:hypothetical protein